jgi:hypothetical protein
MPAVRNRGGCPTPTAIRITPTRQGREISSSSTSRADYSPRFHPTIALYYTPRLDFIYSGRLRDTVRSLSVESADVLMILMSAIARLDDPGRGSPASRPRRSRP